MTLTELHLFAGIGGGILGGMLLGHRCIGAVELDPYCRHVLEARQRDGCLAPFPIFRDVRSFDGRAWRGVVDVVCGGFPCQPWSSAGRRLGTADPRHLWPEMARIIDEIRPTYVFAENVNIKAFAEPWRDLRGLGYRVPPALCLAAADCGAPHLRKRWWLLAADTDTDGEQLRQQPGRRRGSHGAGAPESPIDGVARNVPDADVTGERTGRWIQQPQEGTEGRDDSDADGRRRESKRKPQPAGLEGAQRGFTDGLREAREQHDAARADASSARLEKRKGRSPVDAPASWEPRAIDRRWWSAEPRVGRVAHGVPARVDRLRALGNAQVPVVAATAFRLLLSTLDTE